MGREPLANQPPRSDLPASYRNPWTALGDDLRAVWADLGLRLRELWRRNGEGSLPRPRWWPPDLVPLFWPLLLAAAVALVIAAGLAVQRWYDSRATPPSPMATTELLSAPEADGPGEPVLEPQPELGLKPERPIGADLPAQPEPIPDLDAQAPPEPAPTPAPDPLASLLQRPEANGLILAATAEPAAATLTLQVRSTFLGLSAPEQQRRADQWQQWAQELGYDHLLLRDSGSGLLARDALVGSGMIVLTAPRPS
ncbi:hypothetical protein KBZ14_03605 [Synechococcus sp. HJ21-Hayes]|jgi:hypothetical protein|uniref:hypothetical protein n=1 Tax=unclassified Synechococcus TaxID=2626047 RepID=UPI0020CE971A|nr:MULTISPECIES: hypothetical protein [unclassified Synechococcus]MCP9830786.1 hypothetical protein [Synechococcus sp. JJ3a-Johnson]MCP9851956.1 hypothetical protein [Synechococcus sp. HJ21-Hayes]